MLIYLILALLAVFIYVKFIKKAPEEYELLAPYYSDKCWTISDEVVDTEIYPFTVEIEDSQLDDLNKRIEMTRYPLPSLINSKFTYGVNRKFMKKIVEYWKNSYDWRKQEKELNKFPQFKTRVEGLDIHFIHVKPKTASTKIQPKPLLMIHGWPGSTYEFHKIIPMLTDPTSHGGNETDSFEVIVPSIPGYGFSQAAEVKGFNAIHCGRVFHKLMLRLGHKKYYIQGGDWGSGIATYLSMLYPSAVKGQHFTMNVAGTPPLLFLKMLLGTFAPTVFFDAQDAKKIYPMKRLIINLLRETGYMHLQATKPDTVGFALTDSPVGLAAYLLEKFSAWTSPDGQEKDDGDIPKYWTYDELLTNIMIYWLNGNITSSMRLYKESFEVAHEISHIKVKVPAGFAWFPNEVALCLKGQLEGKFSKLISFTRMKEGGHFSAFEVPHLLTEDLRNFVRRIEREQALNSFNEAQSEKDFKQTHLDRVN